MVDYESKIHNAYMMVNFMAMPELRLFGTIAYNKAEGALNQVIMPNIEARLYNSYYDRADLEDQDHSFTEMNTYSDLDYGLLQLSFGLEYAITPTVTFTADAQYSDLKDNTGYVFGDESGSMVIVRSGFKVDF